MKRLWILGLVGGMLACKTNAVLPVQDASSYAGYREELGASLPDFPDYAAALEQVTPKAPTSSQTVDGQLEKFMQKGYDKAKGEPYFNGFTVLVFSGIDRNLAFQTEENLSLFFPDLNPEMQYQQPRYLIKIGRYGYKIEAQKVFYRVKAQFPSARIIQDRFLRKEYTPPTTTPPPDAQGKN